MFEKNLHEGAEIFKKPTNSSSQMYNLSRNSKPINNPSQKSQSHDSKAMKTKRKKLTRIRPNQRRKKNLC
jgi:hypothetical protein